MKNSLKTLGWILIGAILGATGMNIYTRTVVRSFLSPERRVEHLVDKLDLSDSQRQQVQELVRNRMKTMRRQFLPEVDAFEKQIEAILEERQFQKFERWKELRAKRRERLRKRWHTGETS